MSGFIARCDVCRGETAPQPTQEAAWATLKRHVEGEHPRRFRRPRPSFTPTFSRRRRPS